MDYHPTSAAFNSGRLRVSDLHEIYFHEYGNPHGPAILYVHGGPGAGTEPGDAKYFDPHHYRIVLFDQRGCGQSTPYASLDQNTTPDLIADIEKLRAHLKIDRWIVFGGSWGSTLSLLYAEAHPAHVRGLILRGIFLCRRRDLEWFYQSGASFIFPEAWAEYEATIPVNERADFMTAYHKRLTSDDRAVRLNAARTWSLWEGATSKLIPDPEFISRYGTDQFAEAFARIESHYFVNRIFLRSENQILDDVPRVKHLPCEIVHGRYDVVCPVEQAVELHRAWPESRLTIVPDAGHSAKEPGIRRALLEATERFKTL